MAGLFAESPIDGRPTFCAEESPGNVDSLASHDNDLLTIEQLLGDSTG